MQLLVLFLVLRYKLPLLKKAQGTAEKLAQENCLNSEFLMFPILCFSLCSTFVFLVPLLVLYFQFSRATSRALLSVFSCNFSCPFSCSTFGFLVQLLVPFLVLYFRFSRATSGALPRAIFLATVTENFQKKKGKKRRKTPVQVFSFCFNCEGKATIWPPASSTDWRPCLKIAPSSNF